MNRILRIRRTPVTYDNVIESPSGDILAGILDRAPRERRELRPGDYLHVSDLLTKCVRKIAIVKREGIPVRPHRLSPWEVLTYAQGEALHNSTRELACAGGPEFVWGKWACKCGYLFHEEPCTYSEIDKNDVCEHCGTATLEYQEISLKNDKYMIVGHPDLMLYIRKLDALHVCELKSIAHDQWKELARPLPDHVLQVLFYWWLAREEGLRITDRISIFYISKGFSFKGEKPYKEFVIDPLVELHRLDPYLSDAKLTILSRTTDELPPRSKCKTAHTATAMKCEACTICFDGE